MFSILAMCVTLYSGLFYLTEKVSEAFRMLLYYIVMLTNLFFVVYWFIKLILAFSEKFRAKCPKMTICLVYMDYVLTCGCLRKRKPKIVGPLTYEEVYRP